MTELYNNQVDLGKNILGPIFYDFCRKLYLYQSAYQRDAVCLFAYRGGVRLLYLYNEFLRSKSLPEQTPQYPFLISRLLALKGAIQKAYPEAEKLLLREYPNILLKDFFSSICKETYINIPKNLLKKKIAPRLLYEAVFLDSEWALQVQKHFKTQRFLLKKYIESLVGNYKTILFIDTGWSGTTQYFLMKGFPEYNWNGLYFGKWDTWKENPPHFYSITGISVEGTIYDRSKPETSILKYHHIIEAPLEPDFPSVELLIKDSAEKICSYHSVDQKKIPPQKNEPIFKGICLFFKTAGEKSIADISKQVYIARKRLEKKILYPSRKDINIMKVGSRSADFGRNKYVPVFHSIKNSEKSSIPAKMEAVKKSIWKQGKIVEEFPLIYPILLYLYNKIYK